MVKPYSIDLRERVLKHFEEYNDVRSTSKLFNISTPTIYRWRLRKQKEGHVQPIKRPYVYKKINYNLLRQVLKESPDLFLFEIAKKFSVTPQAIFYACKKLKITRKKRQRSI